MKTNNKITMMTQQSHLIRICFAFDSNQMHLNQTQMRMNQMQMQVQIQPSQGNQMQVQVKIIAFALAFANANAFEHRPGVCVSVCVYVCERFCVCVWLNACVFGWVDVCSCVCVLAYVWYVCRSTCMSVHRSHLRPLLRFHFRVSIIISSLNLSFSLCSRVTALMSPVTLPVIYLMTLAPMQLYHSFVQSMVLE